MTKYMAAVAIVLLGALPAFAASGDAWAEFVAKVEESCVAAAEGTFENPQAIVDPFGSENYGLAIVTGTGASGRVAAIICVFDKQTETVQIGGELDVSVTSND
ncbi:MAG: hypothetical protein P0Y65_06805 [Candidatus Devosia phytovorans]|uniref:Uncharacterized protein n=1 Tax=Candidatus Devosia phytovorans TaxID=3121372 RepID=A0AAJ5VYP5_9HYPH|nr:hypothetical protein [Devosia sp.]WEK05958.1 MAG: hypothetical protein P0Y65_06805 [Devosia sp.]